MVDDVATHQENYRTEYKEIAAHHRFFTSLRFIVAAFTITLQSTLFTLYGQSVQQYQFEIRRAIIMVVGALTMMAVILIERRNIALFRVMARRGKELEFNLGLTDGMFGRLSEPELIRPKGLRRVATHSWGVGLISGTICILWIAVFAFFVIQYERRPIWQNEMPRIPWICELIQSPQIPTRNSRG